MENLLMYVVENLLKYGEIYKMEDPISSEDAWGVIVGDFPWVFTRSEIMLLNEEYNKRLAYLTDKQIMRWNRLFSQLN